MDYEALGKRIRSQRKLLGMTQEELSEKVGVSCSFIGHIAAAASSALKPW